MIDLFFGPISSSFIVIFSMDRLVRYVIQIDDQYKYVVDEEFDARNVVLALANQEIKDRETPGVVFQKVYSEDGTSVTITSQKSGLFYNTVEDVMTIGYIPIRHNRKSVVQESLVKMLNKKIEKDSNKSKFLSKTHTFLDKIKQAIGREKKLELTTALFDFIVSSRNVLFDVHEKFKETVYEKLIELRDKFGWEKANQYLITLFPERMEPPEPINPDVNNDEYNCENPECCCNSDIIKTPEYEICIPEIRNEVDINSFNYQNIKNYWMNQYLSYKEFEYNN